MPKDRDNTETMRAILALHPEPQVLLQESLVEVMSLFKPMNNNQTVDYLVEYMICAGKLGALVLSDHAVDHPEDSRECIPTLLESFHTVFEKLVREHYQVLVDRAGIIDVFAQSDINRQAYNDIMDSIKERHDG